MEEQNFKKHTKLVPPFHMFLIPLVFLTLIGSLVNAIFPAPGQLFNLSGIYITALTIAIFGLTFPDGWGIREFTLIKMLTALASIPTAVAGGLALFSRVWWMAAEAGWVGLALVLGKGQKARSATVEAEQLHSEESAVRR